MSIQRIHELLADFSQTPKPKVIFWPPCALQKLRKERITSVILDRLSDLENAGLQFERLRGFLIVKEGDFASVISMISTAINSQLPLPQGEVFACFHNWEQNKKNHAIIMLKDSGFSEAGEPIQETIANITHEMVHVHDEALKATLPRNDGRLAIYADQLWSEFIANKVASGHYSLQYMQQQIDAVLEMNPIIPQIWILCPSASVWQLLTPFGRILGLVPDQNALEHTLIHPLTITNPDIASLIEAIYASCYNTDYLRYRPIFEIEQALNGWYECFKRKHQPANYVP